METGITGQRVSEAIKALSRSTQVSYDRTYEMVITKIEDVDAGLYRVDMAGNENVPAVAIEGLKGKLNVGDKVLVKVPNGDLSSISDTTTNLIEYKLKTSGNNSEEYERLINSYYDSGVKISDIYNYTGSGYGLIAGAPDDKLLVNMSGSATDLAAAHSLLQMYLSKYHYLKLSAKFKTGFNTSHTYGNYGVRAVFKDSNGNEKTYPLDFSAFVGTPYNYTVFNTQEATFNVLEDELVSLERFEVFEEGFEADQIWDAASRTWKPNTTIPNIFVDNIEISFSEKSSIEPDTYYLYIETPQGTILQNDSSFIELIGKLIYNTTLLPLDDCQCYWYQEDANVTPSSENYDKLAGFGWKRVETSVQDRITINASDVPTQKTYKLIVIYKDKITTSTMITVARFGSVLNFSIRPTVINNRTHLQLIENDNISSQVGNWYVTLPSGQYSLVQLEVSQIDVSNYSEFSYATFTCAVLDPSDNSKIIETLQYVLRNDTTNADVTVTFVGSDLYHYDANGQITIDEAERERQLEAVINVVDGKSIKDVKWYWNDQEITQAGIDPIESMIQKIKVDSNNILIYNIRKNYRGNYINNQVRLVVSTFQGDEISILKDFTFLKDGDQGTNGSQYSVVIRPYDRETFKGVSGFKGLVYDGAWGDPLYLAPFVYREDEELAAAAFKCEWSIPNENLSKVDRVEGSAFPHAISVQGTNSPSLASNASDLEYWIKATVTVDGETLYASYPVNVVLGSLDFDKINISTLPSYIKYSASGYKPEYLNKDIEIIYDKSSEENSWDIKTPTLLKKSNDGLRLYPATSYNGNGNHVGVTIATVNGVSIIHPVIMYLNTFGNEAINSWDGTRLELDPSGQYILAPQIGAGTKDSTTNKFSGVVMGKQADNTTIGKTGLYGYQDGVASFGLLEDGTAFFGRADRGGRINLNGSSATISGGDGGDATSGMTITLANLNESGNTKAIKIGAGKFFVNYDGTMHCTGAEVAGTLTAGGGSTIGGLTVGTDGSFGTTNGNFKVTPDGSITLNGSITWYGGNSPVKYQYSTNNSSWHDTMTSSDKYRRESWDGGKTWGAGYQFKGSDGAPGSDANVPKYIQSTYIDFTRVDSPYIRGNNIEVRGGAFKVCPLDISDSTIYGYVGYKEGLTGSGVVSQGVALTNGIDSSHYVVATDSGVRLQAGSQKGFFITSSGGIQYKDTELSSSAFYVFYGTFGTGNPPASGKAGQVYFQYST